MSDRNWKKMNMRFVDSSAYCKDVKNKQPCHRAPLAASGLPVRSSRPAPVAIVTGLIRVRKALLITVNASAEINSLHSRGHQQLVAGFVGFFLALYYHIFRKRQSYIILKLLFYAICY